MSEPFADPMPHVDGVSHVYVDAGGLRMHVAQAGPEDGEPIVLLHGWPQHWYLWRDIVPLLSGRYRLVMPDLRGLGWTEITKDGYEKEQLARDVLALMDAMGLERVKLMGHDWGGYAGFLMCVLAPERIERYLALNIIHPFPTAGPRALLNSWRMLYQLPMLAPFLGPRVTRIQGFVKRFLLAGSKKSVFDDHELEAFEAPLRDRERAAVSAKYYRSFQAHDLPLLVRRHWRKYRLTVPTLMLHGTGDFAIPPSSLQGFEPYADDMRIEFVQDTGHFVVDARPDEVAARALEFFASR